MPLFFQSEIFPKASQTLWLQSKIWVFARDPLQSTLRNGGNNGKNSGAVNDMCRYLCWVRVTDMFLQNQSFLPADFNFFWAEDEISNNQGLAGCIRRDLPLSFQSSSSPEPFGKPRNKGFLGNVYLPLSGRGGRKWFLLNRKIFGMIKNAGRGGCQALIF